MITDWSVEAAKAYETFTRFAGEYVKTEKGRQDMANSLALMQFLAMMAIAQQLSMIEHPVGSR